VLRPFAHWLFSLESVSQFPVFVCPALELNAPKVGSATHQLAQQFWNTMDQLELFFVRQC
jgi:hypothetical protein